MSKKLVKMGKNIHIAEKSSDGAMMWLGGEAGGVRGSLFVHDLLLLGGLTFHFKNYNCLQSMELKFYSFDLSLSSKPIVKKYRN